MLYSLFFFGFLLIALVSIYIISPTNKKQIWLSTVIIPLGSFSGYLLICVESWYGLGERIGLILYALISSSFIYFNLKKKLKNENKVKFPIFLVILIGFALVVSIAYMYLSYQIGMWIGIEFGEVLILIVLSIILLTIFTVIDVRNKKMAETKEVKNSQTQSQMILTIIPECIVDIGLAGSCTATIDWGDGTILETHTLIPYNKEDDKFDKCYYHNYSSTTSYTITITGEKITALSISDVCEKNKVTSLYVSENKNLEYLYCNCCRLLKELDISNNIALTNLACNDNHLMELDISKNIALEFLMCSNNQLTSLDVTKNVMLESLICSDNQLANLDVSKNTILGLFLCNNNQLTSLDVKNNIRLFGLECNDNNLSETALDTLFHTLHDNPSSYKVVSISGNKGMECCNKSIAENKRWRVES